MSAFRRLDRRHPGRPDRPGSRPADSPSCGSPASRPCRRSRPPIDQLLVLRSLQGLGFGGEWAAGATLMSEVIAPRPARSRRRLGAERLVGRLRRGGAPLHHRLPRSWPPEVAWRALFLIGALPARRRPVHARVPAESRRRSPRANASRRAPPRLRVREIFEPPLGRITAIASLIAAGALGGNYTILTWLPTYLSTVRHLSVLNTGGYLG